MIERLFGIKIEKFNKGPKLNVDKYIGTTNLVYSTRIFSLGGVEISHLA
jgi:hypothetical protein